MIYTKKHYSFQVRQSYAAVASCNTQIKEMSLQISQLQLDKCDNQSDRKGIFKEMYRELYCRYSRQKGARTAEWTAHRQEVNKLKDEVNSVISIESCNNLSCRESKAKCSVADKTSKERFGQV